MSPAHTIAARAGRSALWMLLLLALAGCGRAAPSAAPAGDSPLVPVLAVSELVVGPNRLAVGVLKDGTPLNSADLKLGMRFFYLDGADDAAVQSESAAVYRGQGLPFGLYVGYATFDKPGNWSVEISIPTGGAPQIATLRLDVLPSSQIPSVGQPAIASDSLTVADNADLSQITSDAKPDPDLYRLSVADAIAAGRPSVVAFSTPGYCQTAVCGPNMLVLKQLKDQYKGQITFVHVEVYPFPFGESFQAQRRVAAMREWHLQTEPWTFLVDAAGVVQYRYEGGITFDEMQPALAQLAAGQAVTPLAEP